MFTTEYKRQKQLKGLDLTISLLSKSSHFTVTSFAYWNGKLHSRPSKVLDIKSYLFTPKIFVDGDGKSLL